MRIARPKRPEADFKRKRSPPPQATKLLRYSMLAGIVLIVLLGIVFIPPGLREQPTTVVVNPENGGRFRLDTSNGTRLYIDSSTAALALTNFNATFWVSDTVFARLDAGLIRGNETLSFADANGNGALDSGDYFAIRPPPTGCYNFKVYQLNLGKLAVAGLLLWGGCPQRLTEGGQ